jgi:hypothetical protein
VTHPAWFLVVIGLLLAGAGVLWLVAPVVPGVGRLPGDVAIERQNFRFYFPLTTCIVASVVVSGIVWLVRYLSR